MCVLGHLQTKTNYLLTACMHIVITIMTWFNLIYFSLLKWFIILSSKWYYRIYRMKEVQYIQIRRGLRWLYLFHYSCSLIIESISLSCFDRLWPSFCIICWVNTFYKIFSLYLAQSFLNRIMFNFHSQ